jgi:D-lactate dehydrogenase
LNFISETLTPSTASKAAGASVVCAFVNDDLGKETLRLLATEGVKIIAMRCAGFNNVELSEAGKLGIKVVRVPAYSPAAVAEHAVALMMVSHIFFAVCVHTCRESTSFTFFRR